MSNVKFLTDILDDKSGKILFPANSIVSRKSVSESLDLSELFAQDVVIATDEKPQKVAEAVSEPKKKAAKK